MRENVIKTKSFEFAVKVVNLYKWLCDERKEYILSKQLLRSGTSIGALVREAEQAESKADFIHKLAIAQKESNETLYWIELLKESEFLNQEQFNSIYNPATEIMKLLTSIIKSTKQNLKIYN